MRKEILRSAPFLVILAPLLLGACASDKPTASSETTSTASAADRNKADQALQTAQQALQTAQKAEQEAQAANQRADQMYNRSLQK